MSGRALSAVLLLAGLAAGCDAEARFERRSEAASRALAEGQLDAAEKGYERLLADAPQGDRRRVAALNGLAATLQRKGDAARARALYREALDLEATLGADPAGLARGYARLALDYQGSGDLATARALLARSLEIRERELGPEHPDVAESLNNLALLDLMEGRADAAEAGLEHSMRILSGALADHPGLAATHTNMGQVQLHRGVLAQAEKSFREALRLQTANHGADSPQAAQAAANLADVLRGSGATDEAERLYLRAIATAEKAPSTDPVTLANRLNNLAVLYREAGRHAEAEAYYSRAIVVLERTGAAGLAELATSIFNLARLYETWGRTEDAGKLYDRALAMFEDLGGPDHPNAVLARRAREALRARAGASGAAAR